ncbi:ribonuclease H2 subunit A [Nilaparvata lugens]|uniref:ribonuclease H2 subunit A n=1 Tax=Nilaparvata lugens TaxID=108931 RepID=UPI00193E867F|nr:ribonuclease H2 subunit A [Nilaparvata lugens]
MEDCKSSGLINSSSDFKELFQIRDNSENLILSSNVPELCKTEKCMLGVDEAGRGPVLGPMVYGICYCPLDKEADVKSLGSADSKSLTEQKRETIFDSICKETSYVGWAVEVISPNTICNSMLQRQKKSLNQVSHDSAIGLIQRTLDAGANITEVYLDTVGPPEKYQEKLSLIFPQLKVTVAKKADATYPVVGAASICAKVARDCSLSVWKFREGIDLPEGTNWGSGYPNDPETKKFLINNIDPVFGYPQLVRFSWSTAEKILKEKAVEMEWESDEENDPSLKNNTSIRSFFGQKTSSSAPARKRHSFFSDRNLVSTSCLD